jgi:hypothetical protein
MILSSIPLYGSTFISGSNPNERAKVEPQHDAPEIIVPIIHHPVPILVFVFSVSFLPKSRPL